MRMMKSLLTAGLLFLTSLKTFAQVDVDWPKKHNLLNGFYFFDEQIYKYGDISNFILYGEDRALMLQVDCQKNQSRALLVASPSGFFRSYPDGDEMSPKYVPPGAFKNIETKSLIGAAFPVVCAKKEAKWKLVFESSKYKTKEYIDENQTKYLGNQIYALHSYIEGIEEFSTVGAPWVFSQITQLIDCVNNKHRLLDLVVFDAQHNISDFVGLDLSISSKAWSKISDENIDLIKTKEYVCAKGQDSAAK